MTVTSENIKSLTQKQLAAIFDVMDAFEFDKVERHMHQVNWTWHMPDEEDEARLRIPTQSELREALRSMLIRAYDGMNMWRAEDQNVQAPYMSSCGGFTVYVWPNDACQVYFSVTDWWVDGDTIKNL